MIECKYLNPYFITIEKGMFMNIYSIYEPNVVLIYKL